MDLATQAQQTTVPLTGMTPEDVAALRRRNYELECENKVRRKEAKLLRDNVAVLNGKLESAAETHKAQTEALQSQSEAFQTQATALQALTEELKAQLAWFRNQLFGATSERRILEALSPADQLWLGQQMLLEVPEQPPAANETAADVECKGRGKSKRPDKPARSEDSLSSRLHFDDSAPIEEVIIEDKELDALPKDQVEIIGQDVTYKLGQRSPYVVIKTVRTVWKKKGEEAIRKATLPIVVERSIADVSFLAGMAVDKHCYHLPLYRQHKRLEAVGIHLQRSTLVRLLERVAEMCELIYNAQLSSILHSAVITMDESPTPAGRANGKMKKGFYWALHGDKNEIVFIYSPTRSRAVIDKFLENFKGVLQSDGYRAYKSFCKATGVCWAGCWAHTRRKFVEAENLEPEKVKKILGDLQLLYEIEERGRGKPKLLKELRSRESHPIVDRLFGYFKAELASSSLLPSNRFVKALAYAIKHEAPLRVFLENPAVQIDTNHIERAIRYPVMGRKNWMFHWTENGARNSGILYSLLQTCYLQGIDPRAYLMDVLQRQDFHPGSDIHELTPLNWAATVNDSPLGSLIDPPVKTASSDS